MYALSADLLALFNDLTSRAAADSMLDTKKYTYLSRAQAEVFSEMAGIAPHVFYPKVGTSNIPKLVTTDNNVFTFGLDANNNPIVPVGKCQIYRQITDIPDRPLRPDWDYINEVTQIRLPRGRTYTSPLYYRGAVEPAPISANVNPAFQPASSNELTALRAAKNFLRKRDPDIAASIDTDYNKRFRYWALVWKQQFARGGVITAWSARDLVTPLL